jgi:hypothetical protein
MREIVFLVTTERPGHIEATAPDRSLQVQAASLEELHHEAREALIAQVGAAHNSYRIRFCRPLSPKPRPEGSDQRQRRPASAAPQSPAVLLAPPGRRGG